ncbi:MAG: hypothetical protein ACRDH2_05510 [Anaerolineales bacterium]
MKPNLDTLDLELLAAVNRDQQANRLAEARLARQLHDQIPNGKEGTAMLRRKLVVAVCVIIPFVWLIVRVAGVAAAAAGGGAGGGPIHFAM